MSLQYKWLQQAQVSYICLGSKDIHNLPWLMTIWAAKTEQLTRMAKRQRVERELPDNLAYRLTRVILQLEAADAHINNHNRPDQGLNLPGQYGLKKDASMSSPGRL